MMLVAGQAAADGGDWVAGIIAALLCLTLLWMIDKSK